RQVGKGGAGAVGVDLHRHRLAVQQGLDAGLQGHVRGLGDDLGATPRRQIVLHQGRGQLFAHGVGAVNAEQGAGVPGGRRLVLVGTGVRRRTCGGGRRRRRRGGGAEGKKQASGGHQQQGGDPQPGQLAVAVRWARRQGGVVVEQFQKSVANGLFQAV